MADNCSDLSAQISALAAQISRINTLSEGQVRQIAQDVVDGSKGAIVSSTKQSLLPDINFLIATAIGGVVSRFQPQIQDAINKATGAVNTANSVDAKVAKNFGEFIGINNEIAEAKRIANTAAQQANAANTTANNVARDEAGLEAGLAQQTRQLEAELKAAADARMAAELTARQQQLEAQRSEAAIQAAADRRAAQDAQTLALSQKNDAEIADALRARQAALLADQQKQTSEIIAQYEARAKALENGVTDAKATANIAVTEAKGATNIATEAKGLFSGISSRVSAVEASVAGLVGQIGAVSSTALEALGISKGAQAAASEALGKVLGVVSKIAEIFVIISAIQEIIAQLKTLEVLGDRIDAVEKEAEAVGDSVSAILGKLLGLQNRIAANTASINDVRGIANTALTAGIAASALANRAIDIGTDAKNSAVSALQNAATAIATTVALAALVRSIKGIKGDKGDPGIPGTPGRNGTNGKDGAAAISIPGKNGLNGRNGTDGKDGKAGTNGITTVVTLPGTPGTPGKDGSDGRNGTNGKNGTNGFPGKDGRDGKDVNPADLAGLKALIIQQHTQTRASATSAIGGLKQFVTGAFAGLTALTTAIGSSVIFSTALNVMTFATTTHNAFMLSNNLAQTLGTIIDQVLAFILPKGLDGTPINIGNILGKVTHEIIADAIGEANYQTISQDWAQANRIYQAGINIHNQLSNMVGILTAGMEMIGGNVAKIGNALKIWGVIGEKAYAFMNPQPNLKGKFFNFLNNATNEANTVMAMVAIPIGVAAAASGVNDSVGDLIKNLDQQDPKDEHGNPIPDTVHGGVTKYQPGLTQPIPTVTASSDAQSKADSTNIIAATIDDIFNAND